MTAPISRFSDSSIASTATGFSINEKETAGQACPHPGQTDAQPSSPLDSLREIKKARRRAIIMAGPGEFQFAERVRITKLQPKKIDLSPPREISATPPKQVGLPPNPNAFLTQRSQPPSASYGLPTPEGRANLKQQPMTMPVQSEDPSKLALNPRNNALQGAKFDNGWKTTKEILGTKK